MQKKIFSMKNSRGRKYYLHGKGDLFYFSPKINKRNLLSEKESAKFKEELNNGEISIKENKKTGLLFIKRL